MIRRVAWLALPLAMLSTPRLLRAEVAIEVGHALAEPGGRARLEVRLRTQGTDVVGTQNDLMFEAATPLTVRAGSVPRPDCEPARLPLGGAQLSFTPPGCRPGVDCGLRALILTFDPLAAIPDGALLYTCNVDVSRAAPLGSYPVRCLHAGGSDPDGVALLVTCVDGAVQVVAELPTATVTATPTVTETPRPPTRTPVPTITRTPTVTGTPCDPPCAAVRVGSVAGRPGERARFGVSIDTRGQPVVGVQVDIGFDRRVPIAARVRNVPDCTLAGDLSLSFQPPNCSSPECDGVRVLVGPRNDPFPDGSELFTCAVDVAADAAPGTYPLTIANVGGTTIDGVEVPMTGSAGAVLVEPEAEPSPTPTVTPVECGEGCPAAVVDRVRVPTGPFNFDVRLDARGFDVAGVELEITLPSNASVFNVNGQPQCRALPDQPISAGIETVWETPRGCGTLNTPHCRGVAALAIPLEGGPIADGAVLLTCTLALPIHHGRGTYPVTVAHVRGSTAAGGPLPMRGVDGAIIVTQSVGVTTASDSGCQIAASVDSPTWAALIGLMLIAVRQKRR